VTEKDERPWIKLSLDYFENPKIDALSDAGQLLHLNLILRSARNKTDGVVTLRACKGRGDAPFKELVRQGLLDKKDTQTYLIHDYEKHQTLSRIIAKRTAAGSRGGHGKNHVLRHIFVESCEHCQFDVQNDEEWLHHEDLVTKP
jgi:hypothetical protein